MTVYLVRHGARGPAGSCFNWWKQQDPSHPVVKAWPANLIDDLTEVGREQMRRMGRMLAKAHSGEQIVWFSSVSPRAMESGALVLAQMQPDAPPLAPASLPSPLSADEIFRPFNINQTYRDCVREQLLENGDDVVFEQHSISHAKELLSIWQSCGLKISPQQHGHRERLFFMPYLSEILSCEAHFPGINVLTDMMTADEQAAVHRYARFVWERRFLFIGEQQFKLGHPLNNFLRGIGGGSSKVTAVCSAHDYSILIFLSSAVGFQKYIHTLEFGATVRLSRRRLSESKNTELVVDLWAAPLRSAESFLTVPPTQSWVCPGPCSNDEPDC